MSDEILLLEQAAIGDIQENKLPNSSQVVASLLAIEKKQNNNIYSLENLVGSWNLRLITGTKKTRNKAGFILGIGRYIPRLIQITVTYQSEKQASNIGKVINSVKLAFFHLSLTGPLKFIPDQKILAFDFTHVTFSCWRLVLYQGYLQNGLERAENFPQQKLKDQAFFKYFLIKDNLIAARGKGGGLALWGRKNT